MPLSLLNSLLAEAKCTTDLVRWSQTMCRLAAQLARNGKLDGAFGAIKSVRAQFGPGLHPEVASWLMLSEGILHFCKFENPAAYDRLQRAHGLAVAFKLNAAVPVCAAWMALIEFNTLRREKMIAHLQEALTLAASDNHQALARANLVAACAFHMAGGFKHAKPWYDRARQHAIAEVDEETLGAVFFNVATFRLNEVRLGDAFDCLAATEAKFASIEAAGSYSYDYMTGNIAQEPWRLLLRGQHLTIERKFEEAKSNLDLVDVENLDSKRTKPVVIADRAWCALNLGNISEAERLLQEVTMHTDSIGEDDDRAFIFGRLAQICFSLQKFGEAKHYRAVGDEALSSFRRYQSVFLEQLSCLNQITT